MLVIELNEFNPNYLKKCAKKLKLRNILYFLNLEHSKTFTKDTKEHHGLDPWVQWVSIHSGLPFSKHKIARLGQTHDQKKYIQIWNKISLKKSIKWGVWGAMNAPSGEDKGRCFFLPDPWSFEEKAFPNSLNQLLSLPRYIALNYLSPKILKILKYSLNNFIFLIRNSGSGITRKIIRKGILAFFVTGINIHSLTTLFDYINCLYFIKYKKKYNTDFSLIFLNHIAHLQHSFWMESSKISNQMKFGLIICNEILGELKNNVEKNEAIILLNGLKQKNVYKKGSYVYRQKDPIEFFKKILPIQCTVKQNMTNDGTLIFNNYLDADKAEKLIKSIKLKDNKCSLYYVERISPLRIFYQIEISKKIRSDEEMILNSKKFKFYKYIEIYAERSGAHIPEGDIYYKNINLPNLLENHKVYQYILKKFT